MPEIVYTVKVVLDPSSEKIVGKAIDEGLEKGLRNAQKEIEKATGKQVNFNSTIEDGNNSIEERNNLLKANITNVQSANAQARNYDNTLKRLITDEKTDIATLKEKAEQHKRFIPVLERSVAEMREYGAATEMSQEESTRYNNTLARAEQTLRTMMSTNINLSNSLKQSAGEMGDVTGQAGRFNKTMSGANQTIFAFGDLVQDSTQFMVGGRFNFATGMRAIGNNVGFAAELFGNLRQNVQRYNQAIADGTIKNGEQVTTLQALRKSFTGVGGVILGVNLAMTGLTLATQLFGKEAKEAEKALDSFTDGITRGDKAISDYIGRTDDAFGAKRKKRLLAFAEQDVKGLELSLQDVNSQIGELQQAQRRLSSSTISDKEQEAILTRLGLPNQFAINERLQSLLDSRKPIKQVLKSRKDDVKELKKEVEAANIAADARRRYIQTQLTEAERNEVIEKARKEATNDFYDMHAGITAFNDELHKTPPSIEEMLSGLEAIKDTEIPLGSIASLEQFLSELQEKYKMEVDESERAILESRIQGVQTRLEFMKNGLAEVLSLEDLGVDDFQVKIIGESDVLKIQDEARKREQEEIKAQDERRLKELKDFQDRATDVFKSGEDARLNIKKSMNNAFLNLAQVLADKNKGIAIGLLALEKARAISDVIIESQKRIFQANAVASTYTAQGNLVMAGLAKAQVPIIKASAAASIAAITAQGLKQGKQLGGGGGGGAGGGAGASTQSAGGSGIISTGTATQMDRNIGFLPARGGEFSGAEITIVNTFDEEKVSEVADRGARKRQQQQVVVA
jgi:hypothetical protein